MEKIEIKKAKNIKERLDDFYKNKGKELWLYSGHYEDNNLTIKIEKLTVLCETDVEYCALSEADDKDFIPVAKEPEFDYCCAYTIGDANTISYPDYVECNICLDEDDMEIARKIMVEEIRFYAQNYNIDCSGL